MTDSHISIKSSDFLAHVFKSFNNIQGDNLYTDVTLVSDDNIRIEAHKLILSAGSEYFRDILSDKAHPHPMLCLDGVTSEDLERVIKYLYVGEVTVPQSHLQKFFQVSRKFKCYGLTDKDSFNFRELQPEPEELLSDGKKDQLVRPEIPELEEAEQTKEAEKDQTVRPEIHELEEAELTIEAGNLNNPKPEPGSENSNEYGWDLDDDQKDFEEIEKESQMIMAKKRDMVPEHCRIEGKTFSKVQLEQILEQLYRCTSDGTYSCKHCDFEPTKERLHILEHTIKHLENFEVDCDRCRKSFESYDSYKVHRNENCAKKSNKISYHAQVKKARENNQYPVKHNNLRLTEKVKWFRSYNLKDVCEQIVTTMDEVKMPWYKLSFTKDVLDPMIADKKVTDLNFPPGRAGRHMLRGRADRLKSSMARIINHFEQTSELHYDLCEEEKEEVFSLIDCIIQDSKKYAGNTRQVQL